MKLYSSQIRIVEIQKALSKILSDGKFLASLKGGCSYVGDVRPYLGARSRSADRDACGQAGQEQQGRHHFI